MYDKHLQAFEAEMDKVALGAGAWKAIKGGLQRAGGGAGAGMGLGAGVGGVGGLAHGGYRGYQEAKEQGADTAGALMSGLGRGISTGMKGAVGGAALGTVAGGAAGAGKLLDPEQVARISQMGGGVGALARSGQRQVHGLTGWTPKEGLRSIRGGAYDTSKRVADLAKADAKPGRLSRAYAATKGKLTGEKVDALDLERAAAGSADDAMQKAERMGLTSLPGYAKSLKTHGVGKTIKAGLGQQWHQGGPASKALMVGFPALSIGEAVAGGDEPGGPGRGERLGGALGSLAYSMGPLPLGAATLLGEAVSGAGRRAGALADRGKATPIPTKPQPAMVDPRGAMVRAGRDVVEGVGL